MRPLPNSIKRVPGGFQVCWQDGHEAFYSYAHLRKNCPCAECRNSAPHVVEEDNPLRLFDENPIYADSAALVGNYAIQFDWNDGHRHGIFAFDFLREICPCTTCQSAMSRHN